MTVPRPASLRQVRADWLRVQSEVAYVRTLFAGQTYREALRREAEREEKYSPDQPRVPAGSSDGGQWTDGGGGDNLMGGAGNDQLAQGPSNQSYQIDLLEEDRRGGHTNDYHIGKNPETLKTHVRQQQAIFAAEGRKASHLRVGSFPTLGAATRLTNSTLSQNAAKVGAVARGEKEYDFVTSTFGSPTGTEAYVRNLNEEPSIRETYGVGVRIQHDSKSPTGFIVMTSYPRNND